MSNTVGGLNVDQMLEEYVRNRDVIWEGLTGTDVSTQQYKLLMKLMRMDYLGEFVLVVVHRKSTSVTGGDALATERSIVDNVLRSTGYFDACNAAIEEIATTHTATVVEMTIGEDGILLCQQKDLIEISIPKKSELYTRAMKLLFLQHGIKHVFVESDLMDRGSVADTNLKPVSLEVATHFLRRGFV